MKKAMILLICISFFISGCAVNLYKSTPTDKRRIKQLKGNVERLGELRKQEKQALRGEIKRLNQLREQEKIEFGKIKRELERKLSDGEIGVEIQERGIVITLANNILFDSGNAEIKDDAYPSLDEIVSVINTSAVKKNIGVEGHTDNVPIKHSGWKSNRELSTARANNVYHYLVEKGVAPRRLTTMGYGEYRPIASNDTEEGRAENRRVEIVILPEFTKQSSVSGDVSETWVK